MARVWLLPVLALALWAQEQKPVEPPEEDEADRPKEYSFNPLQAGREFNIGSFYMKRGNWKGAASRFEEATRWNPAMGDAYLKWAEALEKLKEPQRVREVWARFLEAAPDHRRAGEIRRKLGVKPPAGS